MEAAENLATLIVAMLALTISIALYVAEQSDEDEDDRALLFVRHAETTRTADQSTVQFRFGVGNAGKRPARCAEYWSVMAPPEHMTSPKARRLQEGTANEIGPGVEAEFKVQMGMNNETTLGPHFGVLVLRYRDSYLEQADSFRHYFSWNGRSDFLVPFDTPSLNLTNAKVVRAYLEDEMRAFENSGLSCD
jgi:hypothetical protein